MSTDGSCLSPTTVAARLLQHWGVTATAVTRHGLGMNSQTWLVEADGLRFVAKAVPADRRRSFEAGLEIATLVDIAGIPSGAPVPTRAGRPTAVVDNDVLALLRFVDGSELTGGSEAERRMIGSTLGRVHLALAGHVVADAERFHWLDRTAPHLGLRPWLRPSLDGALEAWDAERGLDMLARMRWAVQADYFAQRVRDSDLTGIDRQADNEKGLEDARRALAAYAP